MRSTARSRLEPTAWRRHRRQGVLVPPGPTCVTSNERNSSERAAPCARPSTSRLPRLRRRTFDPQQSRSSDDRRAAGLIAARGLHDRVSVCGRGDAALGLGTLDVVLDDAEQVAVSRPARASSATATAEYRGDGALARLAPLRDRRRHHRRRDPHLLRRLVLRPVAVRRPGRPRPMARAIMHSASRLISRYPTIACRVLNPGDGLIPRRHLRPSIRLAHRHQRARRHRLARLTTPRRRPPLGSPRQDLPER